MKTTRLTRVMDDGLRDRLERNKLTLERVADTMLNGVNTFAEKTKYATNEVGDNGKDSYRYFDDCMRRAEACLRVRLLLERLEEFSSEAVEP